ncbi:MAG: hypothetical protein PHU85_13850 [Phycisphaerae bacterium]|nr:hypothetical protein [Phycisphaerae bacterium]
MLIASVVLAGLAVQIPTTGKNIDLVTLPGRDKVQLTIYNSEDITLVKESRSITFKKGTNQIQFSWAGTLIDPTSVRFRPLEHAGDIDVADTVISGQKPQSLVWNIESKFEGQATVEVSYFTSGLTWQMDYTAVTDPDETNMAFRGYVRVFNNSGEEYENAEVRLIVGTINLTEKIAQLARRYGVQPPAPGEAKYREMRNEAMDESISRAAGALPSPATQPPPPDKPKQIVKEGLSEYFMFAVEGSETIRNGWSKRMQAVTADNAKFDIVYRMRSHQYGPQPVRFFIWRNDSEHKLGDSPLPDGMIRVFRDNGSDGLAYLGQQLVRYVPIKAEIEVNLGVDNLVVYESRIVSTKRLNFAFDQWNNVCGWDEQQQWIEQFRNYRTKPIAVEFRRVWAGDVEYQSELPTTLYDFQTIETKFQVKARDKTEYPADVLTHQGANSKQARVKLKGPAPKPE